MLENLKASLEGKKTYIVAFGAIVTVLVAWVNGTVATPEMIKGVVEAILAVTLRAGIAKGA